MKKVMLAFAVFYLSLLVILILVNSLTCGHCALDQNVDFILSEPSLKYWFGTDNLGRDIYARILQGGKISLFVGFAGSLIAFCLGLSLGALAGVFGGFLDRVIMRCCDIAMAIPSFVLVSVLTLTLQSILPLESVLVKAVLSLCVSVGLTHWMQIARVTRGIIVDLKGRPFIEAAQALGATRFYIFKTHLLPNMLGTLLILLAMQVPTNILYESFMSFIGLGIHPPNTSWGILLREGWKSLSSYPHIVLFPSLVLFLTVWSTHILIDTLKAKFRL